ncbi:MAG: dicarboxylate/amino acid:cation symporter [Moraxellaceae bacterium]|nr:dicarboxylate/amino acid:cation symporter [Moraxellaceae bacterium]
MSGKLALHWQMLIAMVLGGLLGLLMNNGAIPAAPALTSTLDVIAQLFMNSLKLLVIPVVVTSMIVGISRIDSGIGKLGGYTLLYYVASSTAAIIAGLFFVNLLSPGLVDGVAVGSHIALPADAGALMQKVENRGAGDMLNLFLSMLPPNLVTAASEGNLLGLIVFSLLYGYFLGRLPTEQKQSQLAFWESAQAIVMGIATLFLRAAPIGVFALIANVLARTGFAAMAPMAWFFVTVVLALAFHLGVTLSFLLWQVAKASPRQHFRAMLPALLTAFSTASSNATLPVTLRCLRERAGVSERVSGMTVPLGATINMDGTALYECAAVLFLAQAYGVDLSFAQQLTVVIIALVTSIGVAGIPAASLVAIAIILGAVGLPLEAIGLLLITDRLLDMCRTAVNVYSDSVAAVFVASREGEQLSPPDSHSASD